MMDPQVLKVHAEIGGCCAWRKKVQRTVLIHVRSSSFGRTIEPFNEPPSELFGKLEDEVRESDSVGSISYVRLDPLEKVFVFCPRVTDSILVTCRQSVSSPSIWIRKLPVSHDFAMGEAYVPRC